MTGLSSAVPTMTLDLHALMASIARTLQRTPCFSCVAWSALFLAGHLQASNCSNCDCLIQHGGHAHFDGRTMVSDALSDAERLIGSGAASPSLSSDTSSRTSAAPNVVLRLNGTAVRSAAPSSPAVISKPFARKTSACSLQLRCLGEAHCKKQSHGELITSMMGQSEYKGTCPGLPDGDLLRRRQLQLLGKH